VLPGANAHTQVTSTGTADVETITLEPASSAIVIDARTNPGYLTWNGSTPSSSNGLPLVPGGQPLIIPLGWYANSGHQLKWASSVAGNAVLDLLQMT
jgi:hypothetical protein